MVTARHGAPSRRAAAVVLAGLALSGCGALEGVVTTEDTAPTTVATTRRPIALTSVAPTETVPVTPTTRPAPPPTLTAAPGIAVADALRLGEGGLGRARFGNPADDAVLYVSSVLGAPDADTLWGEPSTDFGICPGAEARVVRWGWLLLVLTDRSDWGVGRRHFAGWRYGPAVEPEALYPDGLTLSTGLGPGATLAAARAAYPGLTVQPEEGLTRFRIGTALGGWATGPTDDATITVLEGGATCRL